MCDSQDIDIGSVVAQRLEAIRRLTENPQDPIGNNLIQSVDTKVIRTLNTVITLSGTQFNEYL